MATSAELGVMDGAGMSAAESGVVEGAGMSSDESVLFSFSMDSSCAWVSSLSSVCDTSPLASPVSAAASASGPEFSSEPAFSFSVVSVFSPSCASEAPHPLIVINPAKKTASNFTKFFFIFAIPSFEIV